MNLMRKKLQKKLRSNRYKYQMANNHFDEFFIEDRKKTNPNSENIITPFEELVFFISSNFIFYSFYLGGMDENKYSRTDP